MKKNEIEQVWFNPRLYDEDGTPKFKTDEHQHRLHTRRMCRDISDHNARIEETDMGYHIKTYSIKCRICGTFHSYCVEGELAEEGALVLDACPSCTSHLHEAWIQDLLRRVSKVEDKTNAR